MIMIKYYWDWLLVTDSGSRCADPVTWKREHFHFRELCVLIVLQNTEHWTKTKNWLIPIVNFNAHYRTNIRY
jgi:hypothetical protein